MVTHMISVMLNLTENMCLLKLEAFKNILNKVFLCVHMSKNTVKITWR